MLKYSKIKIVAALAVILAGGYYFFERVEPTPATPQLALSLNINSEVREPPAGWREYRNKQYGFLFFHPEGIAAREIDEGSGAATVVFQNTEEARGFQIFIVPYAEETISEERFRRDVSSGIRKNVEETYVGKLGVRAVTFHSHNSFLGETREVWFIHNGYLFEVTTFKDMGDWFAPIMQTWEFL